MSALELLEGASGDRMLARLGRAEITASTKFVPPPLPRHWIRRDRLSRQLSCALEHRLTVLTGPPGAGKTVLLADWAHGRPNAAVGWLSVEEADNDPTCFWPQVAAALGAEHTAEWARISKGPNWQGDRFAAGLIGHTTTAHPRVLVIDNFHIITNPSVMGAFAQLVYHLPPNLRVVLAGQGMPGFSLQGLQAGGEVATLGENDLRFTVEESAALVALTAGKFLSRADASTLIQHSEGWAAGLHLAAIALAQANDASAFVRQYSGSFGPVAEYLEHEMFLRQPPDVARFLLQTSVLDSFTADQCRAVGGRLDAGEILEALADGCLFVIRLDSAEPSYRYHRLFADLLRSRLQREDPAVGRAAHLSAAVWLERRGDLRRAAHHFAQAQAHDRALRLVFSNLGHDFKSDDSEDASHLWSTGVPGDICAGSDVVHLYVQAATLLDAHRVSEAAHLLRQLHTVTNREAGGSRWRGRIDFLWAVYADRTDDAAGVLDNCRAVGELIGPSQESESVPDRPLEPAWFPTIDAAIAAHLPILAARAHVRLGQPDEAQAILIDHFGSHEQAQASEPAVLAMAACSQGRLERAYGLATAVLKRSKERHTRADLAIEARMVLAEVLFEHNELRGAEEQCLAALQLAGGEEATDPLWAVEIEFVRVLVAEQRLGEALNRIGHLRQVERRSPPPHNLLRKLNQIDIASRIDLDDLDGALLIARSSPPDCISSQTLARLDLRSGRPDRVLSRLGNSPSVGLATEIRRLVLVACAAVQQAHRERATDTLRLAVATGRPEHYVRPFLEEAPETLPLLRTIAATRPDGYLAHLVSQAERLVPSAVPNGSTIIIEPLTERERQVLDYLPSHLSRDQIAVHMYVSPNTVKTHINALYRKVGATTRAEAVAIARSNGLLGLTATMDRSSGKKRPIGLVSDGV